MNTLTELLTSSGDYNHRLSTGIVVVHPTLDRRAEYYLLRDYHVGQSAGHKLMMVPRSPLDKTRN